MSPKSKPKVFLSPTAYDDFKGLPGNVRRQMITAVDQLIKNPRPANSKRLTLAEEAREIRRIRLGKWRVIYVVTSEATMVLGIRKRPPYDYEDLQNLLEGIE